MKYKVQNKRILTPKAMIEILCKSAQMYSEYADTTLLFVFREKKADDENTYRKLFYEIKKDLFETEKENFRNSLLEKLA